MDSMSIRAKALFLYCFLIIHELKLVATDYDEFIEKYGFNVYKG